MTIQVSCPGCGKAYNFAPENAGMVGACGCGTSFKVPLPESPETITVTKQVTPVARGSVGKLNMRQVLAVKIGVGLIILCGLFPPYEGVYRRTGDNLTSFMSYRLCFLPPSREAVYRKIRSKPKGRVSDSALAYCSSRILVSRCLLQILVVVLATGGMVLVLGQHEDKPGDTGSLIEAIRNKAQSFRSP